MGRKKLKVMPPDAFEAAFKMLTETALRCGQCMGRGWILGFGGREYCGRCRGRGVG